MNKHRFKDPKDRVLMHVSKSMNKSCRRHRSGDWYCLICGGSVEEDGAHKFVTGKKANEVAQENRTKPKIKLMEFDE